MKKKSLMKRDAIKRNAVRKGVTKKDAPENDAVKKEAVKKILIKKNVVKKKKFGFISRIVSIYSHLYRRRKREIINRRLLRLISSTENDINVLVYSESEEDLLRRCDVIKKKCEEEQSYLGKLKKLGAPNSRDRLQMEKNNVTLLKMLKSMTDDPGATMIRLRELQRKERAASGNRSK
jgi:hypothetical protein